MTGLPDVPSDADATCVDAVSPTGVDWSGGSFGPVTCGTKTDDVVETLVAPLAGLDAGVDGLTDAGDVRAGLGGACATESWDAGV